MFHQIINSMDIKAGKILVAEPFMLDPNFKRTVVLIVEHHETGTTGFIINKLLDIKISELIADFPKSKAKVGIGGPVAVDSIHYLHNLGDLLEDSIEVCQGVYWSGNFDKLKFLFENGIIADQYIRFFVGYAGWTEGQLAEEIEIGDWIIEDMDANYLFKIKPFVLWQTVLHNKGNNYTVIAQMHDLQSLN